MPLILDLIKRYTSWLALIRLLSLPTLRHAAESTPDALRIGCRKKGVNIVLVKSHQLLEKRYPQTKISQVELPVRL